jgi:hypothetical protein
VVRVLSSDFWNPFRFTAAGEDLYVMDAARNSIERINDAGERKSVFAFPRIRQREGALTSLSPTEFSGRQAYESDAVPTGAALAGDRLIVALFTGFPFVAGAGEVVSVPLSGEEPTPRPEAGGFNAPVDVAIAADGKLLVLEHGTYDQAEGFVEETGRLVSVNSATGERQVLVDRLTRPTSVLARPAGPIVLACLDGTLVFVSSIR